MFLISACSLAAPSANRASTTEITPTSIATFTPVITYTPVPTQTHTSTPTVTEMVTPSSTPPRTPTETPLPQERATTAALHETQTALWEQLLTTSVATNTPAATFTSSPPTTVPTEREGDAVTEVAPVQMVARSDANLRSCPSTTCSRAGAVQAGERLVVTGRTNGEAVNGGNTLWYRVDYSGQASYIYGSLVTQSLSSVESSPRAPVTQSNVAPTRVPAAPTSPPTASGSGHTALCNDGTYSDSAHRSGTCSHHGGVAQWINRPPS